MQKLTKIIATIGPASNDKETIRELIKSGVNIFRQNFSHGIKESHAEIAQRLRSVAADEGVVVSVLQDLAGPKMRTGSFTNDQIELIKGEIFILTSQAVEGDVNRVSINYPELIYQVSVGDQIRLDDGKVDLSVIKTSQTEIHTKVIEGGLIRSKRGINVPGVALALDVFTSDDRENVCYFADNQYDWVSLSFVQCAQDIESLQSFFIEHGIWSKIIAKIETAAAIKNIDEIINVSDGIMIARGDLAIETPVSLVPIKQKEIIKKCRGLGKPVIVATQMLESMMDAPVPTRAEVSDISNAILDGADAIMLSGETAAGNYPVKSVQAMAAAALATESSSVYSHRFKTSYNYHHANNELIANSVFSLAYDEDVAAIACVTQTGDTARSIAKLRPGLPIYALTTDKSVLHELQLLHGIIPILLTDNYNQTVSIRDWIADHVRSPGLLVPGVQIIATYCQAGLGQGKTDSISIIKI